MYNNFVKDTGNVYGRKYKYVQKSGSFNTEQSLKVIWKGHAGL